MLKDQSRYIAEDNIGDKSKLGHVDEEDDDIDVDDLQKKLSIAVNDSNGCGNPGCNATHVPHKCSRCLSVRYCSRECQVAHWQSHRPVCEELSRRFNVVPHSRFLAYVPGDSRTTPAVDRLDKLNHESVSPRSLLFSVIVETSNEDEPDSPISSDELNHLLQTQLRKNCAYVIPTDSGLARVMYIATSALPEVADVCVISASLPSRMDLYTYVTRRNYAKRKHGDGSSTDSLDAPPSKQEMASSIFESLVLFDKSVFPTLQLFRLMKQTIAIGIVANNDELLWAVLSLDQLKNYEEKIVQTVLETNLEDEFVILVYGTLIDKSEDDTVMLVLPMQAALAFHTQHVDAHVVEELGLVAPLFPHAPLVLALVRAHIVDKRRVHAWEQAYMPFLDASRPITSTTRHNTADDEDLSDTEA
eukprot:m.36083 g.36083  ORF g.36083 m.36083 type:complete len:416 (+) comp6644_c0_seq3:281-1528(+)